LVLLYEYITIHGSLNVYYYYYYYIIIDVTSTNSVPVIGSTPISDEVSQYDSSRYTHASWRATIGFRSRLAYLLHKSHFYVKPFCAALR